MIIFEGLDVKDVGKIGCTDLVDILFKNTDSDDAGDRSKSGDAALKALVLEIKKTMESEAISLKSLKRIFDDIDIDGNGTADKRAFAKVMRTARIPMGEEEKEIIFTKLDKLDKGFLKYADFLSLLGSNPKDSAKQVIDEIKEVIEEVVGPGIHSIKAMKRVFNDIDEDNNGTVSKKEFIKAMRLLKIPIGESKVDLIFAAHDSDGNGALDYHEFLELIAFEPRSAARDTERK